MVILTWRTSMISACVILMGSHVLKWVVYVKGYLSGVIPLAFRLCTLGVFCSSFKFMN